MTESLDAAARASDPSTSQSELADLAYAHPSLRATILANTAIYDGLREWIAQNPGTPAAVQSAVPKAAAGQPMQRSWSRTLVLALAVGGVLALSGGGAAAVAIMSANHPALSDSESSPDATDSGSEQPVDEQPIDEQPTETVQQGPTSRYMPSSCDQIFSAGLVSQLTGRGYALNPTWTLNPPLVGTSDTIVASYIIDPLRCAWGSPSGDNGTWVISTISVIAPDQRAALISRLGSYTKQSSEQLGGTRYLIDTPTFGESYLVREDLLFATRWNNYGPDGYTADMVTSVFG